MLGFFLVNQLYLTPPPPPPLPRPMQLLDTHIKLLLFFDFTSIFNLQHFLGTLKADR